LGAAEVAKATEGGVDGAGLAADEFDCANAWIRDEAKIKLPMTGSGFISFVN
jgi:hypothetical protein